MFHNNSFFVVAVVDGCIHAGSIGTHRGAVDLEEEPATESKYIEFHQAFEAIQNELLREVIGYIRSVEVEPVHDDGYSIVGIDVGIHGLSIRSHDAVVFQVG